MKRLIRAEQSNLSNEKKIKEIRETNNYAQNFIISFQTIYNEMLLRLPIVRSLLDVQAVQIYEIMLEKLKKSLVAINRNNISDKLNLIIQNLTVQANNDESFHLIKKSYYSYGVVEQALQLKKDLLAIRDSLEKLYEHGEILAERTKKILNYHSKHSVLKRIRNIKTIIRWINNEDGFDTDLIGRLDKIIDIDIPRR